MSKKAIDILFEKLKSKINEAKRIAELNAVRHRSEWEALSKSCSHRKERSSHHLPLLNLERGDLPVRYICNKVGGDSLGYNKICKFEDCPLIMDE